MERQPILWLESLTAEPAAFATRSDRLAGLSSLEQAWSAGLAAPLRHRYATSRRLLRGRLGVLLGCEPEQVPLHSPPGARPQLLDGAGWVSLSHSGAALLMAWSPRPIGVDLEWSGRRLAAAALLQRYFPPVERHQLQGLSAAALRQAVLRSWVAKEAAIKWRGGTLAGELRRWCWDRRRGCLRHDGEDLVPPLAIRTLAGWLCAAVGDGVATAHWPDIPASWALQGQGDNA